MVIDERDEIGGLVRFAIAPFREEREPLPEERRMLEDLGVEFRLGRRIGGADALRELEGEVDAIFLGIGLGEDVHVSYPGDELPGVWESLPFIEAIKTDRCPEVGARVAVIGGGNTAIDVAREARRLGADDVVLLYRRTEAEMPAYAHEVAEARDEGVHFQWLTNPVRVIGRDRVEALECECMRLGEPDVSGRRRPEPVLGTRFEMPVDTVIKALGQQARHTLAGLVDGVELDARGEIEVDGETFQTGNPRYFAAGDDVSGGASVVQAVRGGKLAARAIDAQLREATR
jgi:NADPH-dependent glutamate synthase beta subunit-like oxidoreductase